MSHNDSDSAIALTHSGSVLHYLVDAGEDFGVDLIVGHLSFTFESHESLIFLQVYYRRLILARWHISIHFFMTITQFMLVPQKKI